MTYQEAANYAASLKAEGLSPMGITDQLEITGYVVKGSGRPASLTTVKRMIKAGTINHLCPVITSADMNEVDMAPQMMGEIISCDLPNETKLKLLELLLKDNDN